MGRHEEERPIRSERARVIRGSHPGLHSVQLAHGIGDAGSNTFQALGWTLGDMRRRRRLKRLLKKVGASVPIDTAPEGLVRIEGRVGLIAPVHTPAETPVATYRVHQESQETCACDERCTAEVLRVSAVRDAGVFTVEDGRGVAVVERGALILRDYHGNALDPYAEGELLVREGDSVTIIGDARRRSAGSLRAMHLAGYRDSQLPLVFEGTRESPVWVFGPPSQAG